MNEPLDESAAGTGAALFDEKSFYLEEFYGKSLLFALIPPSGERLGELDSLVRTLRELRRNQARCIVIVSADALARIMRRLGRLAPRAEPPSAARPRIRRAWAWRDRATPHRGESAPRSPRLPTHRERSASHDPSSAEAYSGSPPHRGCHRRLESYARCCDSHRKTHRIHARQVVVGPRANGR